MPAPLPRDPPGTRPTLPARGRPSDTCMFSLLREMSSIELRGSRCESSEDEIALLHACFVASEARLVLPQIGGLAVDESSESPATRGSEPCCILDHDLYCGGGPWDGSGCEVRRRNFFPGQFYENRSIRERKDSPHVRIDCHRISKDDAKLIQRRRFTRWGDQFPLAISNRHRNAVDWRGFRRSCPLTANDEAVIVTAATNSPN